MIEIDLCEDAPQVGSIEGDGWILVRNVAPEHDEDSFHFLSKEDEKKTEIPWESSSVVRANLGSKNNYRVRERTLTDPGSYEIKCRTRRGAERTYFIHVADKEPGILALTIGAASTPCAWVVGDDVFKTDGQRGIQVEVHDVAHAEQAHISMFSVLQCNRVIDAVRYEFGEKNAWTALNDDIFG